jgi:hypothetical protein
MLAEAKRLFDQGRYAEAGSMFDRLADGAVERGMLNRAGDLCLQSARCHLGMRKASLAVERGKQALSLFGRVGLFGKIERRMPRMVEALQEKGYHIRPLMSRRELPAKCSACGGPVRPDDITWLDSRTAECPYCGSVLKAT